MVAKKPSLTDTSESDEEEDEGCATIDSRELRRPGVNLGSKLDEVVDINQVLKMMGNTQRDHKSKLLEQMRKKKQQLLNEEISKEKIKEDILTEVMNYQTKKGRPAINQVIGHRYRFEELNDKFGLDI